MVRPPTLPDASGPGELYPLGQGMLPQSDGFLSIKSSLPGHTTK